MRQILPVALLALAACSPLPDTVGEAAPAGTLWRLETVNDAPAPYAASLRLLRNDRVVGMTACGPFTAEQTAPLPWLDLGAFDPETPGCDDPGAAAFYAALKSMGSQMGFAEVLEDRMLLSNAAGQSLFFRAAPDA